MPVRRPLSRRSQQKQDQDVWAYRLAVRTFAWTVLGCTIGAIVLQAYGRPTPELLNTVVYGAIAALAGIVTPSSRI